ncbi:MAG: hypothetical protein K8F91_15235 [Candidatus Obscuribacterales bacterium]|nr:hypothetical protein [Candidatus Obscuribacterales bacterium]
MISGNIFPDRLCSKGKGYWALGALKNTASMEIARERRAGPRRIGELLVAAGVVRQEVLMEALQVAKKSSTPVGRVLMTIGELSERDVLAAIEIQSMLRDNLISAEFGIRALNVCIKGHISLDEAFKRLGWDGPGKRGEIVASGELGKLFIDAGIVSSIVVGQCMQQSEENNLPLGRCLVLARAISSNLLASALTAQVLVRDGKINYEQAVAGLGAAFRKQQSIETSLIETGAYRAEPERIKVGELLSQAGLVTESDKVSAIEKGLVDNQPVGQVLVQQGMISPTALDESLKLQALVNEGKINTLQAAEILRQANHRGVPVEVVMNEKFARAEEVGSINKIMWLIRQAELMSLEEIQRAESLASQLVISLGEVIISKDLIDQRLIDSALQGQKLVESGIITDHHLVKVLKFIKRTGIDFAEALKGVSPDFEEEVEEEEADEQPDAKKGFLGGIFGKFKR